MFNIFFTLVQRYVGLAAPLGRIPPEIEEYPEMAENNHSRRNLSFSASVQIQAVVEAAECCKVCDREEHRSQDLQLPCSPPRQVSRKGEKANRWEKRAGSWSQSQEKYPWKQVNQNFWNLKNEIDSQLNQQVQNQWGRGP